MKLFLKRERIRERSEQDICVCKASFLKQVRKYSRYFPRMIGGRDLGTYSCVVLCTSVRLRDRVRKDQQAGTRPSRLRTRKSEERILFVYVLIGAANAYNTHTHTGRRDIKYKNRIEQERDINLRATKETRDVTSCFESCVGHSSR